MRIALIAATLAARSLGACSGNDGMASNGDDRMAERESTTETPDYRYNPPSASPDLRDIAPPAETSPATPQLQPTHPLAPPPGSPPPPLPPPESAPT